MSSGFVIDNWYWSHCFRSWSNAGNLYILPHGLCQPSGKSNVEARLDRIQPEVRQYDELIENGTIRLPSSGVWSDIKLPVTTKTDVGNCFKLTNDLLYKLNIIGLTENQIRNSQLATWGLYPFHQKCVLSWTQIGGESSIDLYLWQLSGYNCSIKIL